MLTHRTFHTLANGRKHRESRRLDLPQDYLNSAGPSYAHGNTIDVEPLLLL